MNDLHRWARSEAARGALDKAFSNFAALSPADKAEFVARVNSALGTTANPEPMAFSQHRKD